MKEQDLRLSWRILLEEKSGQGEQGGKSSSARSIIIARTTAGPDHRVENVIQKVMLSRSISSEAFWLWLIYWRKLATTGKFKQKCNEMWPILAAPLSRVPKRETEYNWTIGRLYRSGRRGDSAFQLSGSGELWLNSEYNLKIKPFEKWWLISKGMGSKDGIVAHGWLSGLDSLPLT